MKIIEKRHLEFTSKIRIGQKLRKSYTQDNIKNETMLFNCDEDYAYKNGGPITKDFLEKLFIDSEWKDSNVVVDSRVHMLMPGWYPCISGWHHDDVPRTRIDGQPNYFLSPANDTQHCMCVVNSKVAPTEFALGTAEFPDVPLNEKYYKNWHPLVENYIANGYLRKELVEDSMLTFFDCETWHQGVPAIENGWRFFIRATKNTGRKPTNEIRRQVQIYLPNPIEGW